MRQALGSIIEFHQPSMYAGEARVSIFQMFSTSQCQALSSYYKQVDKTPLVKTLVSLI